MRRATLIPVVLTLVLTAGCIHKPSGAVTPWERVTTYNAALAQANNTVEQGAEAVASSGIAPAATVEPIVALTGRVAVLHQQVTAILATGQATTGNIASVKALVDQIKSSIQAMPLSALGIKNPKSQQSFNADINNVGTLADAVLSSLQSINGGLTQ